VFVDDGRLLADESAEVIEFPVVDQYAIQADCFSDAVRGVGPVPVSLEDAIANMEVIDAVFRSADSGAWEKVSTSSPS
jgi:predicted dehydrogenase